MVDYISIWKLNWLIDRILFCRNELLVHLKLLTFRPCCLFSLAYYWICFLSKLPILISAWPHTFITILTLLAFFSSAFGKWMWIETLFSFFLLSDVWYFHLSSCKDLLLLLNNMFPKPGCTKYYSLCPIVNYGYCVPFSMACTSRRVLCFMFLKSLS